MVIFSISNHFFYFHQYFYKIFDYYNVWNMNDNLLIELYNFNKRSTCYVIDMNIY